MSRISLILPVDPDRQPQGLSIPSLERSLRDAGHDVELIVAPFRLTATRPSTHFSSAEPPKNGRLAAALRGLERCQGDLLIIVDTERQYQAQDLLRVIERLEARAADVVVGSRRPLSGSAGESSEPRRSLVPLRSFATWLTGSSDPFSGLVGMTRAVYEEASHNLESAGSHFTLEVLAKVPGRKLDVIAHPAHSSKWWLPAIDDLRHLKKLADHRYGDLSRLIQFCLVGASGMVVDLSCYALFQWLLRESSLSRQTIPGIGPLYLAVSAFLAVLIALTWNFFLNRRLTFSYARSGSFFRQYLTYGLSNALAISVNLLIRLRLPHYVPFFNDHKLAAAVVGIVLATGISFSMSRWVVFRTKRPNLSPSRLAVDAPSSLSEPCIAR